MSDPQARHPSDERAGRKPLAARRTREATVRRRRLAALAALAAAAAILAFIVQASGSSPKAGKSASRPAGTSEGAAGHRSHHAKTPARSLAPGPNLAPGSDPNVLPGPVLIADRSNNRLLEVSPTGKILWTFPSEKGLPAGTTFLTPDDAFYTPNGKEIVATEEDDSVISVIDVAKQRILYRYGHPGVPGSEPGYVHNPDDAMMLPDGEIVAADIMNCRLIVIKPPADALLRQLGNTGECVHNPGISYGSPNGAFPMSNGDTAVTEINGDWLDVLGRGGTPVAITNPPGFTYPSDTNEVRPGVFLSADYTNPGAIETFTQSGRLLWRFEPKGAEALNQPSLALPLPNGDVIANDDYNDRVIVVDPKTNEIVWQYGHRGHAGTARGYLSRPDGVDLAPPHSLTMRFARSMKPLE